MHPRRWYMKFKELVRKVGVPTKYLRLVETTEPTIEQRGGFTLVIRGAYNKLVGREQQPVNDNMRVDEASAVQTVLAETQNQEDSISVIESATEQKTLQESQASSDSLSYTEATLREKRLAETQQVQDELAYSTADVHPPEQFTESQAATDSLTYSEATLIVLRFDESQPSSDSISSSSADRYLYRFAERQYTHEIPVAYVPSGNETLEIRTFTETLYPKDSISVQEGSPSSPLEAVAYYYVEYVIWTGTEEVTVYGGLATTSSIYAESVTVYGGLATTEGIYAEAVTVYGGLASTASIYAEAVTAYGGFASTTLTPPA